MDADYAWFHCKITVNGDNRRMLQVDTSLPVDLEYREKVIKAQALLIENTENSPYKQFQDRYNLFKEAIGTVKANLVSGESSPEDLRSISGKLDDLLSALRAFDDRTSHTLSHRYGKESDQVALFKQALSYEFDNVFSYRFLFKLRNYSQHAGSPITNLKASARLQGGEAVGVCNPTFDSRVLLAKYDGWGAIVRKDLEGIQGEFSVELIVDQVRKSCSRVYGKLLLAQRHDLETAMREVKSAAGRLAEGEYPVLVKMKRHPKNADDLKEMTVEHIRIEIAEATAKLIKQVSKGEKP